MTWATPKTNWGTNDGIGTADLNRIEGNINHLFGDNSADIAGINDLDIGNSLFLKLTGTTDIYRLSTTGRQKGSTIIFQASGGGTLFKHLGSSNTSGWAQIALHGSDISVGLGTGTMQYSTISFVYNGIYWICTGLFT